MFAAGFTILILVHECGHLLAAKRVGLKVGAPVFIPFMGAFIALKDAPRNAWIEAQVAMGGPLLGGIGALACLAIHFLTGQPIFAALAYVGFMLNLFNLAPIGILDGGRIVSALSLWFWLAGFAVMAVLIAGHPNFILFLIIIFSLPYMWTQFKNRKTEFFAVSRTQRWIIAILYFGLVAVMAAGMAVSHVPPPVGKT
jgi:Zn-dependent protease